MLGYGPCPTYVRTTTLASFACRPYIHTVLNEKRETVCEREREMNLSLDFVWILCIHPSTREGTMKSTGFLQARCHPSLNASTASWYCDYRTMQLFVALLELITKAERPIHTLRSFKVHTWNLYYIPPIVLYVYIYSSEKNVLLVVLTTV
jgi:hypothetical protein